MSAKNPPKVSIMLPARDAAGTLEAAAESCLRQSYQDLELVLIENDSTRETRAIMENLAQIDQRVRIVHSPPGAGFIAALNLGWRESRGRFLARMDADDLSFPARIAMQVQLLEARPEIAACGTVVRILRRDSEGWFCHRKPGYAKFEDWINGLCQPEEIAAQRFIDSPIVNPSAMIRRECFVRLGGYRIVPWAEDYDFWLRFLESGMQIAKVEGVTLFDWVDSDRRLTRNDPHYIQRQFLAAKAHFLARVDLVRERGVVICGAGPIGKRAARLLRDEGVAVRAFLEVNPRRIGNKIGGVPVLGSKALPLDDCPVAIGAVGQPGARDRVRHLLTPHGYAEGTDFFCIA